jgi:hypothetical protein
MTKKPRFRRGFCYRECRAGTKTDTLFRSRVTYMFRNLAEIGEGDNQVYTLL